MAGIAALVWARPSSNPDQPRLSSGANPFPVFPSASALDVIFVPLSTNASTRLTLASIQGLVNRDGAEIYLDERSELGNASSLLTFLLSHYGLSQSSRDIPAALARYLPRLQGIAVYDPSRPESINIVTMYAALHRAAIAGPDNAASLNRTYGLPVLFDYGSSDWTRLDAIAAYDRAMREMYPQASQALVSILPPDRPAIRDYLIAAKTFVFYYRQGFLSSPAELAATTRILQATARGGPILGWIDTPTITEENAFVQLASRAGKILVGADDTPNLSVLAALGRGSHWRQNSVPVGLPLAAKTYAVVAVPDGDNVDFMSRRMRQLWDDPVRGTMPITWSVQPMLADLAPPLLDFYNGTASPYDRFVAGPSGAGYVYPDYLGPGDIAPYLAFTRKYLNVTGLDVAWLLNAFPAYEVPYRDATLTAYVDDLRPRGIVLDYADQAKTEDHWMEAGATAIAPVIRSTHLWTSRENFLAKLDAAAAAWDSGAHFLWVTVYPYRFNLTQAKEILDEAAARLPGGVEVVTPERFFALLRQDFVARARADVGAGRGDPIASSLFVALVDSANRHSDAATAASDGGDLDRAAWEAFLAIADVRSARRGEALLTVTLLVAAAGLALGLRRPNASARNAIRFRGPPFIVLTASVAVFVLALRSALAADFWTYPFVLGGLAVAGLGGPTARHLNHASPKRGTTIGLLLFSVFASLGLVTNAAFPLAAIGGVLALESLMSRNRLEARELAIPFALGGSLGFVIDSSTVGLVALAGPMIAASWFLPQVVTPRKRGPRDAWLAGMALALPVSGLAAASTYSLALRVALATADLAVVVPFVVAAGAVFGGAVAVLVQTPKNTAKVQALAFSLAGATAASLLFVTGTVPTVLSLFGMVAALTVAAVSTLMRFTQQGGDLRAITSPALVVASLLILVFRVPPIAYSLSVGPLPEALESTFYAPQALIAAVSALAGAVLLISLLRPRPTKHYPGEADGGGEGEA